MAMRENGLAKLVEEIGELGQVAGKMIQYPALQHDAKKLHPSGYNLRERFVQEGGDVLAAVMFVAAKLGISEDDILLRAKMKTRQFNWWDQNEP